MAQWRVSKQDHYRQRRLGDKTVMDLLDTICHFLDSVDSLLEIFTVRAFRVRNPNRFYGEEYPDTISAIGNLATTFTHLGKLDEAATMQKEVLKKWASIFGLNQF